MDKKEELEKLVEEIRRELKKIEEIEKKIKGGE